MTQQMAATGKSPRRNQLATMPANRATHETMADGALDESHGNHPDEVGENDGQEDVDKKAMLLHRRRS